MERRVMDIIGWALAPPSGLVLLWYRLASGYTTAAEPACQNVVAVLLSNFLRAMAWDNSHSGSALARHPKHPSQVAISHSNVGVLHHWITVASYSLACVSINQTMPGRDRFLEVWRSSRPGHLGSLRLTGSLDMQGGCD